MPSASDCSCSAAHRAGPSGGNTWPAVQRVQILADHPGIVECETIRQDEAWNLGQWIVGDQARIGTDGRGLYLMNFSWSNSPVSIASTLTLRPNGEAGFECSLIGMFLATHRAQACCSDAEGWTRGWRSGHLVPNALHRD